MSGRRGAGAGPRIVVFRNGAIGNTLVSVPLLRALKASLGAHVAVVVDPAGFELLEGLPFVDERIAYDKRGADRGLPGWVRLVRRLRRGGYDTAVLAKRFFRNELLAWASGIPRRVGFRTPGVRSFRLTDTVPYVEGKNIVDLNLDLLGPLGAKADSDRLEIAVGPREALLATGFLEREGLAPGGYVCFHFGGETVAGRRWSPGAYGELCTRTLEALGGGAVLLVGPGEGPFNAEVRAGVPEGLRARVSLCEGLPLRAVAAVIERAGAFVGNDSGPSHLADAVGKRSVVLYPGGADAETQIRKWKPKGEHVVPVCTEGDGASGPGPEGVVDRLRELCRP